MINWSTTDIAGIEFGDSHIAAVRLRGREGGPYVLTHAGCTAYNTASAPKDISEAVKSLWKASRIPTKTVCASLRSASLVLRYFSLPAMSEYELKKALQLMAEEALQMSRDEIVVEWHLHSSPRQGAGTTTGLLAAAPVKDVDRELDVLYSAGLDPVILELRALAVANLHGALRTDHSNEAFCLINLSPHSADVMVRSASGALYPHAIYCRSSTWGESPAFLVENIKDVLRYCEYKLGWESVNRIILTGKIPGDEAFWGFLRGALGVEIQHWDPLDSIKLKSRAVSAMLSCEDSPAGLLAPALGLALRRS